MTQVSRLLLLAWAAYKTDPTRRRDASQGVFHTAPVGQGVQLLAAAPLAKPTRIELDATTKRNIAIHFETKARGLGCRKQPSNSNAPDG